MDDSLLVWTAAIRSGFAQSAEWVAWADREIARPGDPPMWVLDLSLCHSAKEALAVLEHAFGNVAPDLCAAWVGWYLGFLYLQFERGELSMLDLLIEAGRKADAVNFWIDCAAFYLLANEIEGGGPTRPSNRPLAERVADLFEPLASTARRRWTELNRVG